MGRKRVFLSLAGGFAIASACIIFAAETKESPSKPASKEKLKTLVESIGMKQMAMQMMDQMMDSFKERMPQAPPEFFREFRKQINMDEFIDQIIPIYQKYLNDEDVDALIAFYQSPPGKKFVRVQPMMMKDSMAVGRNGERELPRRP